MLAASRKLTAPGCVVDVDTKNARNPSTSPALIYAIHATATHTKSASMLLTFGYTGDATTRSARIGLRIKARWNVGNVDPMDARSVLKFIIFSRNGLFSIYDHAVIACREA
jgi:hypothetical protein